MRVQLFILLLALGAVSANTPQHPDVIKQMHDFIGGFGSLGQQGMGGLGSLGQQGMGGLGSLGQQGMGDLGSLFSQIMQSWNSMFGQLTGSGGDMFNNILGILKSLIDTFFSTMGSLGNGARNQMNGMLSNTGTVFASSLKMKLNPEKNNKKLKQEILAAKKVMETKHANHQQLYKALQTKAPQLSAAVMHAYNNAHKEVQKHMKTMNPEAKKSVQKMHLMMQKAGFDIGGLISSMMGMLGNFDISSIMGTAMSLMSNMMGMIKPLLGMFQG